MSLRKAESKAHEAAVKLASLASRVPPELAGEEASRRLLLAVVSLVVLAGRLHQLRRDIKLGYKPNVEQVSSLIRKLEGFLAEAEDVCSRLEAIQASESSQSADSCCQKPGA